MPVIAASDVLARAQALTNVSDPRPDHFRDNLEAVVRCMNEEAELTDTGVQGVVRQLALATRNRIDTDHYLDQHPEVATLETKDPIFLTGLPRSGTTYFQYLFDQNPSLRMLRTWEGERPVPPPALDAASVQQRRSESEATHARIREATGGKLDALHLSDVDGPQECFAILDQTSVNPGLLWTMSVPGYLDYLLDDANLSEAYAHHASVLKLLQHGTAPRRWALKWPCHLLALDAIADVHPDARFVVTHRDPVQALASNCSLARLLRTGTSPHANPARIGQDMLALVRQHVDRLIAFDVQDAESTGRSRLIHVDYYRLVADPTPVMAEVFPLLGLEWSDAVEESIRSWRSANPKGRRGTHTYTLEEFGLDREAVAEAFAPYMERFQIPSESTVLT